MWDIEYTAPEVLIYIGHGRAADWWSLGILMYDMIVGTPPFEGECRKSTMDKILNDKLVLHRFLTNEAASLLHDLLQRVPQNRLGAGVEDGEEVKRHPFFGHLAWDDVLNRRIEPPFQPDVTGDEDTSQFDTEYTEQLPIDSPDEKLSFMENDVGSNKEGLEQSLAKMMKCLFT